MSLVVDGDKKVPIVRGIARLELAPGSHSVEVTAGNATTKRNIVVTAGKETVVEIATTVATEPPRDSKGFPTRKVIGGVSLGPRDRRGQRGRRRDRRRHRAPVLGWRLA